MPLISKPKADFDKYYYYQESVQSPENDVLFLKKVYKDFNGKKPKTLREDFCGTFAICCEWVQLNKEFEAFGIDLDSEPIKYGKKNYLSQLSSDEQNRVKIVKENVLTGDLPKVDVAVAVNFSYYIFKTRKKLIKYFKNARRGLKKDGVLVLDCFGGAQCMTPNEEETEHDGFSYFWDQDSYDALTNFGQFYIHFKRKGEKKRERVFSYDWRLWSIPELKECLMEAGFEKTVVYWEGTDEDGEGDGEFQPIEVGEDCEAWVSYIVAQ